MCDKDSNTAPIASEMADGESTPPADVKTSPELCDETKDGLPEVIPVLPNAPII